VRTEYSPTITSERGETGRKLVAKNREETRSEKRARKSRRKNRRKNTHSTVMKTRAPIAPLVPFVPCTAARADLGGKTAALTTAATARKNARKSGRVGFRKNA